MSNGSGESIVPSVLDRLIERTAGSPGYVSTWEQLRDYKAALCRDLSALLNTRRAEEDFDPSYAESTNSLLSFGIVDFTSYNLKNGIEQERVRRSIERAIRQFEPRLTAVEVLIAPANELKPILEFQIAGLIRIETVAEPVVFNASLQRDSRRFSVLRADA